MNFKKNIALLIAVLIIGCAVVSCGETTTPADTTQATADTSGSSNDTSGEQTGEETDEYVPDDLPALDYEADEFTLFTWSNQMTWEWSDNEETTGDIIKDAIFKRQSQVESRLNIKFNIVGKAGEWENRQSFIDAVYNNVSGGATDAYDAVGQYTPASAIGIVRGCYIDLNDAEYLNFSKPWWPTDITKSGTIKGKVFCAAGDISPTLIRNMGCLMVNLTLADSMNMPNMYELVRNKEWTAEEFLKYGAGTVSGLNPDGSACYTTTMSSTVKYDDLLYAGGFHLCDPDPDAGLVISAELSSPRMADWFDLWKTFWANDDVVALAVNGANGFTSGNVLFHFGQISDVQNYLQEIDFSFGILPYPKYDKNQDDYCTICGYWVTMYSIPVNATNKNQSGAVLECLASEAYRTITPAVYEISFKWRFLNSLENAEMFGLLHDTLVFDIGRTMGDQISCFSCFRQAAGVSDSWTSYYGGQERSWAKSIKNIVKAVDNLKY